MEKMLDIMGIRSISDYVQFYRDLNMGNAVSLVSFVNNEKIVLKHKLQNKESKKEQIIEGIKILDQLMAEIKSYGEKSVLEKYS
jgi:hypothetical protein